GSAVPLAAALATVKTLQDENLVENSAKMGERLMAGLRKLQKQYPFMGDVRGRGLMMGVEITAENNESKSITSALQKACLEKDLLLLTCGTYGNVIRWIPPLIVTAEQIDEALSIFKEALKSI
ncbi:MAG TPA: aminotransferase class III-fold pyridoxal phosphate-dependent enzyme, partial [Anaerolineales bacterium]|nr:aminotransferase class III-fold pyridoxal phosphate-dependent enzyme [Anaerolineales bacterium]